MKSADFFTGSSGVASGPYLHHDPIATGGGADYFGLRSSNLAKGNLSREYDRIRQAIDSKLQQAEQFEQTFYEQFGVQSQRDFSQKYFVDMRFGALNDQDIEEIFKNGSLAQRIMYLVTKTQIVDTVLSRTVEDLTPLIEKLYNEETQEALKNSVPKAASMSQGTFVLNLISRSFTNKGKTTSLSFKGDKGSPVSLSSGAGSTNQNIEKSRSEFLGALYDVIKNDQTDYNRDKMNKEVYKLLSSYRGNALRDSKDKALSIIRKDLENSELLPVEKFKNNSELREAIISKIIDRLDMRFEEQLTTKQGLFYKKSTEATGGLMSFGLEVSLLAEIGVNDIQMDIESIGNEYFTRVDSNKRSEGPSDLVIGETFMLQLKSGRAPSLDTGSGKTILRKSQSVRNLLNDLQVSGLMSADSAQSFEYLLVNYLQRKQSGDVNKLLIDVVEQAVELFVKSDTIPSMYQQVEGLPISGAGYGNPYDIQTAQNHFWVVNDELIPISSFLRPLKVFVEDLQAGSQSEHLEPWYSIQGEIQDSVYDHDKLFKEKLDASLKGATRWYNQGVLGAGIQAGNKVISGVKIPQINLSDRFIQALKNIKGGAQ